MRRALISRGWFENKDHTSHVFHYKFALKKKECFATQLENYQMVNHFQKNSNLVSKAGLCQSIKNLVWWNNSIGYESFFPRCYTISDEAELDDFKEQYKFIKAQSLLKKYIAALSETK